MSDLMPHYFDRSEHLNLFYFFSVFNLFIIEIRMISNEREDSSSSSIVSIPKNEVPVFSMIKIFIKYAYSRI